MLCSGGMIASGAIAPNAWRASTRQASELGLYRVSRVSAEGCLPKPLQINLRSPALGGQAMPGKIKTYDVIVIGSGSGGSVVDAALGQGLSVALVTRAPGPAPT